MLDILTATFVVVDDFCKQFEPEWNNMLIQSGIKKRNRQCSLQLSEIMTILIAFQKSGFRNFKKYYKSLKEYHSQEFPNLPSYNRFITLQQTAVMPLCVFFHFIKGSPTDVNFIDSTSMAVCKTKRIHSHKVFKNFAKLGKSSMGWFFGFKLHLAVNHIGQPLVFTLTQGNVDDRSVVEKMLKNFWGKIYGDKGYISKELFEKLFQKGIHLITALKTNMKEKIIPLIDSENLKKRSKIESVFNVLKNVHHLEHSRHRSIAGFMVNALTSICCYALEFFSCTKNEQIQKCIEK